MSSIAAVRRASKHVDAPHLVLLVDGRPLDERLDEAAPGRDLAGLVPTFLDWLTDEAERRIVWSRARPAVGAGTLLPVLMCPDDVDLWCTTVVAECEASASGVIWRRLGIDAFRGEGYASERCGEQVEWIAGVGPFEFDRGDYERCLATFRGVSDEDPP